MKKCGLVQLSDLQNSGRRLQIFRDMEKFIEFFLHDDAWRPDVPWPRDPLHQWSRQFEYPYAFERLLETSKTGKKVLDAGSGITFFPYYLALHGFNIVCVDSDVRLSRAFEILNHRLPEKLRVRFQVAELQNLPFQDNAFSHVCCISVLEHLHPNDLLRVIEEFSRVLMPGGICFLSIDVSLEMRSDATFTLSKIKEFVLNLERNGLMPVYDIALQEDTSVLLRTDYYRSRDVDYLPWTNCSQRSTYHRARHWLKTRVLRRGFFESLALAVFVCRKEK